MWARTRLDGEDYMEAVETLKQVEAILNRVKIQEVSPFALLPVSNQQFKFVPQAEMIAQARDLIERLRMRLPAMSGGSTGVI